MSLPPHRVVYSPIIDRPKITWPNNARVAFWVAPNVEHYEYLPDYDGQRNPWPRMPYPDVREYSYRDYGNRAGFWRMTEVLVVYLYGADNWSGPVWSCPHCMTNVVVGSYIGVLGLD
jgi:hypothetical protein